MANLWTSLAGIIDYRLSGNFGAMDILPLLADDKKRQIKKRQFFQLQNLKMSEIERHCRILPGYFYIYTLNTSYQYSPWPC